MTNIKLVGFGTDFLKYNFSEPYENSEFASHFIGLSANSNYRETKWFGYELTGAYDRQGRNDILIFSHEGIPVFRLKKYNGTDKVGMTLAYSLDFYSSYFRIPYLRSFYRQFREKYGKYGRVSRLDIACDLAISMQDFVDAGWGTSFKELNKYRESTKTGVPQSIYFGTKDIKNKRHLIRVYDKKADTIAKGKFHLFKDYFTYDHVIRIETEIRSTSCRELGLTDVDAFDTKALESVFRTLCLNKRTTFLKVLENLKFKDATARRLTLKGEFKALSEQDRFKRFIGAGVGMWEAKYPNIMLHLIEGMWEKGAYQNREELLLLRKTINNYLSE